MLVLIKVRGKAVVRARKEISLVISDEGMDAIIRIIISTENSGVLIDGVGETIKHEIKKQEGRFIGMLLGILSASMLRNILTGKCFLRARKGL